MKSKEVTGVVPPRSHCEENRDGDVKSSNKKIQLVSGASKADSPEALHALQCDGSAGLGPGMQSGIKYF